jgi:Bacterial SH3 domain
VGSVIRALFAVSLLAVPLLVITEVPRFFELAGSVPAMRTDVGVVTPTPTFRLGNPTPVTARSSRNAPLSDIIPPTLAPPVATATAVATPRPTPTGERIISGNTGGQGAVLRSEPVTGKPVSALREQQVLDVLERRNVPGSGDWIHVRTADGRDGWVTGVVAVPLPRSQ